MPTSIVLRLFCYHPLMSLFLEFINLQMSVETNMNAKNNYSIELYKCDCSH